jgi:hypothetical protein
MAAVEKLRKHPESGRVQFLLEIDSLDDWPEEIALPKSPHFVLFLACDPGELSDDDLSAVAKKALEQGAVYVSAWGGDAERVHDVFDQVETDLRPDSTADDVVLSEWHDGEPLSAALLYAVSTAWPAAAYEETCKATLAVVVGDPDAAEQVRGWMKDPSSLDAAAEDGEDAAEEDEEEEAGEADDEDEDAEDAEEEEAAAEEDEEEEEEAD